MKDLWTFRHGTNFAQVKQAKQTQLDEFDKDYQALCENRRKIHQAKIDAEQAQKAQQTAEITPEVENAAIEAFEEKAAETIKEEVTAAEESVDNVKETKKSKKSKKTETADVVETLPETEV